jgi:hypothetical protein
MAGARTPVAAGRVAVVAGFRTDHLAVPTKGRALLSRHAALVADFNGLATGGAAVAREGVAIIAGFRPDQNAIATPDEVDAGLASHGACPSVLELAAWGATVAHDLVAIVTRFAWIEEPVSTRCRFNHDAGPSP